MSTLDFNNKQDPARYVEQRVEELKARYNQAGLSVASLLCDQRRPEALAFRIIDSHLVAHDFTYGQLAIESKRFAAVLSAQGVKPGDRVATLMGKSREYLITLMGIWRLGAVHVPLFTAFAPAAIAFRLLASNCQLVVCDGGQREKLQASDDMPGDAGWRIITTGDGDASALEFQSLMAEVDANFPAAAMGGDAPLIHIYTSGTTGKPKGVVVPGKALAAFHAYSEFALDLRDDDIYWCAADPGWAYGLYFGILSTLITSVRSLLYEGNFSPDSTITVLADHDVTNFAAAPTVYRALRAAGVARAVKLRCASSAGEPLTPEVNQWAAIALGVTVHDHYGQTEAGMLINNHHHPLLNKPLRKGSMGNAMPGWTAVVLREDSDELAPLEIIGRVAIDLSASPLAWFDGYFKDATKSAEKFVGNGRWYVTGDTGMVDADGYFYFSSRDDDVIIMAGYRIGPFDVESVLATHPSVAESAVIAVPDEIRGEVIEAYVVLRDQQAASTTLAADIQQWVKKRFAAHAYPRAIHFVTSLPKTPSGKLQRFVLRQQRRAELLVNQ
jgi:acetyl-CoA synthetase